MINNVQFNQDFSCFAVANSKGFNVFNADPLECWVSRDLGDGTGLFRACVLDRTNYLVLVCSSGGGKNSPTVLVWNDLDRQATPVHFDADVLNVAINRNVFAVVLKTEVRVLALADPHKTLQVFKTHPNPHGVVALTGSRLYVPGIREGELQIAAVDKHACTLTSTMQCHRSAIRAIAANDTWLATASTTGTLIRVIRVDSDNCDAKFLRRGLDKAAIWSLALSGQGSGQGSIQGTGGGTTGSDNSKACTDQDTGDKLAVLSDKGTLHVYGIGHNNAATNERHSLARLPLAPKYFGDEWSSARIKTGSKDAGVVGWVSSDACVVVKPRESVWEKYVLAGNELVLESMKHIH